MFQTYKHFSTVFHNFIIFHNSCFVVCGFFAGCLKRIAPSVGFKHDFSAQGFEVSHLLCARGVRIRPFKKFSRGLPGGMVRLGID